MKYAYKIIFLIIFNSFLLSSDKFNPNNNLSSPKSLEQISLFPLESSEKFHRKMIIHENDEVKEYLYDLKDIEEKSLSTHMKLEDFLDFEKTQNIEDFFFDPNIPCQFDAHMPSQPNNDKKLGFRCAFISNAADQTDNHGHHHHHHVGGHVHTQVDDSDEVIINEPTKKRFFENIDHCNNLNRYKRTKSYGLGLSKTRGFLTLPEFFRDKQYHSFLNPDSGNKVVKILSMIYANRQAKIVDIPNLHLVLYEITEEAIDPLEISDPVSPADTAPSQQPRPLPHFKRLNISK